MPTNDSCTPKYKRVILKLSGEMMKGKESSGFCPEAVNFIADEIVSVASMGVEVGVVVGGGNIFRGNSDAAVGMNRTVADQMGMLATTINGLMLQDRLEHKGLSIRVMSAVPMNDFCEPFILRRAQRHLSKGRVLILTGGTGNPYCTTDSAAVLRANELEADVVLKGTKVDGIYTKDPRKFPDAQLLKTCTYERALSEKLGVMDMAAIASAEEEKLPVVVYRLDVAGNSRRAVMGEVGTLVTI
ncbi:MAG: UMP kinase [Candidatus Sumerlaeia bacterium]|nr:UMP kinase [Candidatus Sumerlaeia bacterium]